MYIILLLHWTFLTIKLKSQKNNGNNANEVYIQIRAICEYS